MTATARAELLDYLQQQLIGPVGGDTELIADPPEKRYATAVLFPRDERQESALEDDIDDTVSGPSSRDPLDDPIALASQWMPSSAGLSFYLVGGRSFTCSVSAARYEQTTVASRRRWARHPIEEESTPQRIAIDIDGPEPERSYEVLGGLGRLHVVARPLGTGYLVTVSLVNEQVAIRGRSNSSLCLTQVGLRCEVPAPGRIEEYPRAELLTSDEEEEELLLVYRSAKAYAIGHGCAVRWESIDPLRSVRIDFIPSHEVPALEPAGNKDGPILQLARLADDSTDFEALAAELDQFHAEYVDWIRREREGHGDVPAYLVKARARLIDRMEAQAARIAEGIALLRSDELVRKAFRLANSAMLRQIHHSKVVAKNGHPRTASPLEEIDYTRLDQYRWYPFQLAFMLLTLPGVASVTHEAREIVDLIWFPTGGGKTEAYLAVAAIQIFLRRLRDPLRGGGTTVITRYTLRLLTTQQFQRAAALVCAAETLRAGRSDELGDEPITIGLWIGDEAAPNSYLGAEKRLNDLRDGASTEGFLQLERCPWCGTVLIPPEPAADPDGIGAEATPSSFRMFCPSTGCTFSERLPVTVVDEDMYERPPTIVIGTVDKFAMLAWSDQGGAFFGLGGHQPPSLIIQDELHLISGPLGTTVGIYEAAIDGLLRMAGATPKVIASTATIRRASDQVCGVFGRQVALFPPSGLSATNSYFASEDLRSPGRLYAGLMSGNHTASTALIQLSAALAQGPIELRLAGKELDAYWTQVIYHNSIRELGNTLMYARDDIPARVKIIASDQARMRDLPDENVVELTSTVEDEQIAKVLDRLDVPASSSRAISILVATNMIQVGIDVPRLGLMLVNGQPKTTSEYIQASSRVGRDEAKGLIIAMYQPSKPRDRSHYEAFLSYHQALYRHVEPTSVTPFSLPARERALHAALVILVRHGVGLSANNAAGQFRASDPAVLRAMTILLRRASLVDVGEASATKTHLERIAMEWESNARAAKEAGRPFHYQAGRQHRRLLKPFFAEGDGLPTLHSMRSVDREGVLEVVGSKTA